ncbi:MAG: benzoate-CoA ligase family protein [Anaerolineales bacterium]|nr:benzoate-CoA ligase family protein [Anaerolineales bacterium]
MSATTKPPDRYNASAVLDHNLAEGRGGKVAIYSGDQTTTYQQLSELANRTGNALKDLGVEPEQRVLMLLLDTPQFPTTFFGAIKIGAVPIPANTVMQPADYEYFLNDSRAKVAVVSEPLYKLIEPVRANCPDLKHVVVAGGDGAPGAINWQPWVDAASPALDPADTSPDDVAFWLYSSGSTGFPKGAVHLQHDIAVTIENYARGVLNMTEDDLCFSGSKLFHAYGLGNNMTFAYGVGASTVLFPGRPTPDALLETITRFRPTLFFSVPTMYAAMLAVPDAGAKQKYDLGSVRLCVSAAEALPAEIYRQWKEKFGLEILDGIGSTEMLHIFISNYPGRVKAGSSGQVVPGYRAKLTEENGMEVPAGEIGDLLISGDSAAPFYWNKHEKSKRTMRGEWMFTGDKYHVDADDYYWYDGRSDDMLKVGGAWVSPIEVESVLIEHPAVLESAVVGARDEAGLVKAKAFVVLKEGRPGSPELARELQEFVKGRIAPYKYPRMIEFVPDLPKTVTGKIQRYRLRQ